MDDGSPLAIRAASPVVETAVSRAAAALLERQKPDGHWVFELEADATIPAEYILRVTAFLQAQAAQEKTDQANIQKTKP